MTPAAWNSCLPAVYVRSERLRRDSTGDNLGKIGRFSCPHPNLALTRPMRNATAKLGEAGFQSLWAGQVVARVRVLPEADPVNRIVEQMQETGLLSSDNKI
jgi:NAD(P)H-dependent flavin oxidoreductase YrpB (nitropropane dioxygenase family)